MQLNSDKVAFLFPGAMALDAVEQAAPLAAFDDRVCSLLAGVSKALMKSAGQYPDVLTFAFWCRAANLAAMQAAYRRELRFGRGIVFHITPSNVPVNFAYSLAAGLLAGNLNIVRVPTPPFAQVDMIVGAFAKVFAGREHSALAPFVHFLRYGRDAEVTATLSALCDVRVIWGGDAAITDIRRAPLHSRAFDVTFADRYSLCAIHAGRYLKADARRLAQGFYNDTYLFDQNACTAPHLVVWSGEATDIDKAKDVFWPALHTVAAAKYRLQPVQAVAKLAAFYKAAIDLRLVLEPGPDNLIIRARLDRLEKGIENHRCAGGYFTEYSAKSLDDIVPILNRKYQTLAYYGFNRSEIENLFKRHAFYGLDRIVPIGHTTDFSLVWDGYDLISTLSRICSVECRPRQSRSRRSPDNKQ